MKRFNTTRSKSSLPPERLDIIARFFNPAEDRKIVEAELKTLKDCKPYHRKSFTFEQRLKLLKRIQKDIETDGRYVGLAIMFYTGLRPAEARALCWSDIHPFLDRPDLFYLTVHKILDEKGNILQKTKSANGYRRIPIHIELQNILQRRRRFVEEKSGKKAEGFICSKNESFGEPVWDYEFANIADKVMNRDLLEDDLIEGSIISMIDDQGNKENGQQDNDVFNHFTLYVLRRNFWTWMQAETSLTELEKLYLMGHKMENGKRDLRPYYNSEDHLITMLEKMNHFVVNLEDHFPLITSILEDEKAYPGVEKGVVLFKIPKERLKNGGEFDLSVKTNEPNDTIMLFSITPYRKTYGNFSNKSIIRNESAVKSSPSDIILEYDNLCALKQAKKKQLSMTKDTGSQR